MEFSMKKYIYFIVNPISGKGKHNINLDFIHQFFDKEQYKIEVVYSKHKKHAVELAQLAVSQNPDVIVACGGDGTINEVASALVGTSIPLGIIPVGSGNGLASNLQISRNIQKAFQTLKGLKPSNIDVGSVNGIYFFSNMGLGIDALIIKKYESFPTRSLYTYVKASLFSATQYKPRKATVSLNNQQFEIHPFLLFVSNSNEMGYNMSLTPKASLQDGLLDVLAIPKTTFLQKLYFGGLVLSKKVEKFKKAQIHQTQQLTVHFQDNQSIEAQIDGEFYSLESQNINIELLPKALKVITD